MPRRLTTPTLPSWLTAAPGGTALSQGRAGSRRSRCNRVSLGVVRSAMADPPPLCVLAPLLLHVAPAKPDAADDMQAVETRPASGLR
jgi:hypothetical protein